MDKAKLKLIRNGLILLVLLGLIFYFKMHAGPGIGPIDAVDALANVTGG